MPVAGGEPDTRPTIADRSTDAIGIPSTRKLNREISIESVAADIRLDARREIRRESDVYGSVPGIELHLVLVVRQRRHLDTYAAVARMR